MAKSEEFSAMTKSSIKPIATEQRVEASRQHS